MYKYLLAVKYLLNRPINLVGAIGTTLAVWALILVVSIFTGYLGEMRQHIRGSAADLSYLFNEPQESYEAVAEVLQAHEAVAALAPRVTWYGLLDPEGGRRRAPGQIDPAATAGKPATNFFQVIGIDVDLEHQLRDLRGDLTGIGATDRDRMVADPDRPFLVPRTPETEGLPSIVLGLSRADADGWDLRPGAVVTMTSARQRPRGSREPIEPLHQRFVLSGVFASRYFEFENATAFVDIDVLRSLFPPDGEGLAADWFNEVAIRVDDPENAATVRDQLRGRLIEAGLSGRIHTWQERPRFSRFLENVEHQRSLMGLVLFVLMLVSCFLIFATLLMMVSEKTRDIGILASLGATRRGVLAIFVLCGLTISALGAGLGAVTSWISCIYLNDINDWITDTFQITLFPRNIYGLDEVPYELDPIWIGTVVGGAIGLTLVFSLVPAWLAARLDPVRALRRE